MADTLSDIYNATFSIVPEGATPGTATNQAAITTTTAVAIIAAEAGKKIFITHYAVASPTAAEEGVILLKDTNAVTAKVLMPVPFVNPADLTENPRPVALPRPIEVTTGLGVTGEGQAATTGDTFVTLWYYTTAG